MNDIIKDRLIREEIDLNQKRQALSEFLKSQEFTNLSPKQHDLLRKQEAAMSVYSDIIRRRLEDLRLNINN